MIVTTKQNVQATIAIQKFWAISWESVKWTTSGKGGQPAPLDADLIASGRFRPWKIAAATVPASSPAERAVPGRPLPEHPQQEGREQGRVDEPEDQLEHVHDVIEP